MIIEFNNKYRDIVSGNTGADYFKCDDFIAEDINDNIIEPISNMVFEISFGFKLEIKHRLEEGFGDDYFKEQWGKSKAKLEKRLADFEKAENQG